MVDLVGFEPTTYSVQTSRSSQLELQAHILQNLSTVHYILSAKTLLSWSAEPHRILSIGTDITIQSNIPYWARLLNNQHFT